MKESTHNLMPQRAVREAGAACRQLKARFEPKGYRVLVSNWGFVLAPPPGRLPALKLYEREDDFRRELRNYPLVAARGIPLPGFCGLQGTFAAGNTRFWVARVGNVRGLRGAFSDYTQAGAARLAKLLAKLHAPQDGVTWIHGNMHPSNLFEADGGRLGIFDLADWRPGPPEYDLGTVAAQCRGQDATLGAVLAAYRAAGGRFDDRAVKLRCADRWDEEALYIRGDPARARETKADANALRAAARFRGKSGRKTAGG